MVMALVAFLRLSHSWTSIVKPSAVVEGTQSMVELVSELKFDRLLSYEVLMSKVHTTC